MDNVALMKEAYANFAAGNIEAVLAVWDPQIEWHQCKGMPLVEPGSDATFVGHQAVLEGLIGRMSEFFDGFHIEIGEIFGSGDRVVMSGHYAGTFKATGKPFKAAAVHLWTFRNGKATKYVQVVDTAEILNPKG